MAEAQTFTPSGPLLLYVDNRGKPKKMSAAKQDEEKSVVTDESSVSRGTEHGARLDFKNKNVKMAGNLVANTDAVTHQVEEGNDQCDPQHQVLVNKTIEILIEEQESWSQKG